MASAVPVLAYLSTLRSLTGISNSGALTCTFVMTGGWEGRIPIRAVQTSGHTSPPEIRVYRNTGGAFESDPLINTKIVFPLENNRDTTVDIVLDTGLYVIQLVSGSNTATMGVFTQEILTAIQSV